MKKKKVIIISAVLVAVIAIAVTLVLVLGKKKKEEYRVVKVKTVVGNVTVNRDKKDMDAFADMKLEAKDEVDVADSSMLELLMDSDKHMVAEANTKFKVSATGSEKKGAIKIDLLEGKSLYRIDNKLADDSTFDVKTPNATFSVRGTEFVVIYDVTTDSTFLSVLNGTVHAEYDNDEDSEDVGPGGQRIITGDQVFTDIEETAFADYDISVDASVIDSDKKDSDSSSNAPAASGLNTGYASYNEMREHIYEYIDSNPDLTHDYIRHDYMKYDYDLDGEIEIVWILGYHVEDSRDEYVDILFMDHDANGVKLRALVKNENHDYEFYCEYNGQLGRYSWNVGASESYLYLVVVDDKTLSYVLEAAYDEVLVNYEDYGMKALPLYGEWELILDD